MQSSWQLCKVNRLNMQKHWYGPLSRWHWKCCASPSSLTCIIVIIGLCDGVCQLLCTLDIYLCLTIHGTKPCKVQQCSCCCVNTINNKSLHELVNAWLVGGDPYLIQNFLHNQTPLVIVVASLLDLCVTHRRAWQGNFGYSCSCVLSAQSLRWGELWVEKHVHSNGPHVNVMSSISLY